MVKSWTDPVRLFGEQFGHEEHVAFLHAAVAHGSSPA
jgi:hypothetical protein